MVTELNLPSDAILEISETISSIAQKARIQQSSLIHLVMPAHNNNVNDITIVPAAYVVQNSAPMDQAAIEKRLKMAEEEQEQRLQKMEAEFVQQRAMSLMIPRVMASYQMTTTMVMLMWEKQMPMKLTLCKG